MKKRQIIKIFIDFDKTTEMLPQLSAHTAAGSTQCAPRCIHKGSAQNKAPKFKLLHYFSVVMVL